ncbi:TetR family transcriptional regulator [Rhodococcus sp. 14-2483-1-1]|uniref:TetR/AcrR family transcriptional regulator n=1 Tax=Rhodococcus sp. 14-2483-1-1 TaxID=2023148 RepID=UPI000B9ACA7D|nr:TetR/AcrR family transcriptional regulator [Rhodococcus sp. 14-2483-1-1]OZF41014.1 TetR family transcriptional regulator [Rhodococcus sp. 14-2483-1-1]
MATPSRGRPSAFDRDLVLLAAARLFWRHGFSGTSTRALTTATGLSTSSLYAAFGSKAGLFEEAVRTYTVEYRDIYTRAVGLDSIAAVIESILTNSVLEFTAPSDTHPGCFVSSAVTNDSADTLDAAQYISELHRANERTLHARIERAIAEGELPVDTSADAIVGVVQAIWHGLSVQSRNAVPRHALISTAKLAASSIVEHCRTESRAKA